MNIAKSFLALLSVALIAAAPPRPAAGFNFGDWDVTTGEIDTNYQTGSFTAPQPVNLVRPGARIQANRATGNFKTKQGLLSGNVHVVDQTGQLTNFAGNGKPSSLTCDSLQLDGVSKIYIATGRVHFTQGSSWANADRAVMNGNTHDLHLYGHVQLHQ